MEWLESRRGQVVGLDTAPLIYFIEEHPVYLSTVVSFFQAVSKNELQVVTSTISLTEVLVRPLRQNDADLARQYREILQNSEGISCAPLSSEIAEEAARLRSENNIRTPDAIQMATAILHGAESFLTNDAGLPSIPNLQLLVLNDLIQEGAE